MKKNKPIFTIITVCYNSEDTIEKTISSVIEQSYEKVEFVIIDGGSNDRTVEIIKKYKNDSKNKITFLSEKDNGIYDAMNKGIKLAKGDWVNFMNSGDTFYSSNVLEELAYKIGEKEEIVYGKTNIVYNNYEKIVDSKPIANIWKGLNFCHQSAFVKAELFQSNLFDTSYKLASDFDLFYNFYNENKNFMKLDMIISNYDFSGISTNNSLKVAKEYKDISLKYNTNFIKKSYFFLKIIKVRVVAFVKNILPDRLIKFFQFKL